MLRKNLSLLFLAVTCAVMVPVSAEENVVPPLPTVNESLLDPPSILDPSNSGNATTSKAASPAETKLETKSLQSKATSVNILQELEKRAKDGDAQCQFNLGRMYALGDGISQNKQEALRWYRKSALQKYPPALAAMSIAYRDGHGVQKNPQYAAVLMAEAARLDKTFESASLTMQKEMGTQNSQQNLSADEILKQH